MPFTKTRERFVDTKSYTVWDRMGVVTNYSDEFKRYKISDSRTGSPNPNWRKQIKRHESATTPLSGNIIEYRRNPTRGGWTYEQRDIQNGQYVYRPCKVKYFAFPDQFKYYPTGSTMAYDVALREATKKFFRRVKEQETQWNGLVFIGELRELIRMLRNPAKSLFESAKNDYLGALKKRKTSNPRNWAKGLSGAWLEWSYGVAPTVRDIQDASDAIARLLDKEYSKGTKITAVGRDTKFTSWSDLIVRTRAEVPYRGLSRRWEKVKVKYRGEYRVQRTAPTAWPQVDKASKMLGFTLNEFVPTIWELMPWSFLVDYFSNVGDVLEQSFTSLQNLAWCNQSVIRDAYSESILNLDTAYILADFPAPVYRNFVFSPGVDSKLLIRNRAISRNNSSPVVSSLAFELPGAPQKWLNMAALGIQANSVHPQDFKRWGRR